jgi:hypothetical protein
MTDVREGLVVNMGDMTVPASGKQGVGVLENRFGASLSLWRGWGERDMGQGLGWVEGLLFQGKLTCSAPGVERGLPCVREPPWSLCGSHLGWEFIEPCLVPEGCL